MANKKCKKCNLTDKDVDFYASINCWCKDHWKEKVRLNRVNNIEHYRQFDRDRANLPHRVAARKEYAASDRGREKGNAAKKLYLERHPERRSAHIKTGNAIRDGRLARQPCEVCGNPKTQAHHDDYSKPLDVRWLCVVHHALHHKKEREKARAA
jgi:hypothetical protein